VGKIILAVSQVTWSLVFNETLIYYMNMLSEYGKSREMGRITYQQGSR